MTTLTDYLAASDMAEAGIELRYGMSLEDVMRRVPAIPHPGAGAAASDSGSGPTYSDPRATLPLPLIPRQLRAALATVPGCNAPGSGSFLPNQVR